MLEMRPPRQWAGDDRIAVVIPALDAASALGEVVLRTRSVLPRSLICVVDDGSTDGTGELARGLGCMVVRHPRNLGKGAALRSGFAAVRGSAGLVLTMDADGQHDPRDIPRFWQRLREYELDIVVGNRLADAGAMPFDRYLSNRLSSAVVSLVAGLRIPDSQCGFRLFRRGVLDNVELTTVHFDTESEFLVRAARAGFRIGSVPIAANYGAKGSHISRWNDTLRFIRLMLRLYREFHTKDGGEWRTERAQA